MRLILRTMALDAKLKGQPPFSTNPNDYAVIVDGPSIGRIYKNPVPALKDAEWVWALQVPPFGHGYSETLEQAKAEIARAYKP